MNSAIVSFSPTTSWLSSVFSSKNLRILPSAIFSRMASGLLAFFGSCNLALVLNDLGRAVGLRNRNGGHGRSLHGNGVCHLGGYLLVEAQNHTELLVEVYVGRAVGSLDAAVVGQLNLLARLTRLLGHHLLDGVTLIVLRGKQRVAVGCVVLHGYLQHGLCRSGILGVLGHEVGLAGQAEHVCLLADDFRYNDTLRSGTVGTLGNHQLTLLADNVLSTRIVAFRLLKGLLAVHHAGAGHLAELHHISSFDFHSLCIFNRS